MVNLAQKTYKMYEQLEVRVKEKAVMIPANRVIEVSCKANLDQINNRRAMLLQIGEVDVYRKHCNVKTTNK